ncbi:MAG: DoxX family protein [Bryobacterales bacterium]|nr:DoxX family protein [Bryobacterales bacterium]
MDDSIAHPGWGATPVDLPAWKSWLSALSAILLALLFLASGVWKITDPLGWAARIVQMQLPAQLSVPLALGVGAAETFAAALLFVPRFRRWGALLAGALLVVFMVYVAAYYNVLRGEDCSCFPWLKRSVGPGFFIGDGLMLVGAFFAWKWGSPAHSLKSAALVLAAIAVFTGASYGFAVFQQTGLAAPESVLVEGKPYSLAQGRVFVYFFDPECMHCFEAAQRMKTYKWVGAKVLVVPTRLPEFAGQFLNDTGLKAPVTTDAAKLREIFKFNDPPYAVALEHGRQKAAFIAFDEKTPVEGLRALGWVE